MLTRLRTRRDGPAVQTLRSSWRKSAARMKTLSIFGLTAGRRAWLGGTDFNNDGPGNEVATNADDWYWLSTPTESMVYRNWDPGEPNGVNHGEDFIEMLSDGT